MRDGTPVYANSHIGGLAELMVTFEEWVVPVFTKASAADLGMVCSCVASPASAPRRRRRWRWSSPASIVAVVGCGPLGLSAVQGARIAGASTIIAIDPIRARRERRDEGRRDARARSRTSRATGSSSACARCRRGPPTALWAGGRNPAGRRRGAGADFVVEAVGPRARAAEARSRPRPHRHPADAAGLPDVRARRPLHHDRACRAATSRCPAILFAIGGVTHHGGQAGGASPMRDIPRFVELLEKGQYNAKALATTVVPIERMLEAYEEVAYRTTITAIMTA